jgi:uncharacterized protein (DUF1330 family)
MSDREFASPNPAAIPSAEIGRRSGPVGCSEGRWRICSPELKARSAPFRAAIVCALLVSLAWRPVMARGGFMHGMSGFGMHGDGRMGSHGGEREGLLTPGYVLITVSKITDAEAFKAAVHDLIATTAPFAGRLAVDMDKPVSWEGTAPEYVVMLQFDNPDQAQGWKSSEAFKSFDAELHRSSESTVQLVQGLPTPAARGIGEGRRGRGNVRFDQKAFEPNVKEYDQMLNKMHGICKGC